MADPNFTINDFPTELIERFAPDLRPRTISTLRLVSRRFRDVFTADRYFRCYLCYPDQPEEEIGHQGGRWRRCLEKEKGYLNNWRNGRPTRIDTFELPAELIPIININIHPPGEYFDWSFETGENGEQWALVELDQRKIALVNLTTTPPILAVIDVSENTSKLDGFAILLPDQVLIDKGTGFFDVFNIINHGIKLFLEHLFVIEGREGDYLFLTRTKSNGKGTCRNLYISYKCMRTDGVLRVWDLQRAVELSPIDLIELLSPKCALGLSRIELQQASRLFVSESKYPHIKVNLEIGNRGSKKCVMAVVDVERRELVLWLGEESFNDFDSLCYCQENYAVIECHTLDEKNMVSVFDLRMHPTLKDDTGLVFRQISEGYCDFLSIDPIEIAIYTDKDPYEVVVVRIDGPEVLSSVVRISAFSRCEQVDVTCVIGPFLVISSRSKGDLWSVDMKGNVMFGWSDLLPEGCNVTRFVDAFGFSSLSKCVLVERGGRRMRFIYF